jgi:hypothetical protein
VEKVAKNLHGKVRGWPFLKPISKYCEKKYFCVVILALFANFKGLTRTKRLKKTKHIFIKRESE